jgi:predicted lipoprotein
MKNPNINYLYLGFLCLFISFFACNKNEIVPDNTGKEPEPPVVTPPKPVERKAVLTNIFDNALVPAYEQFALEAVTFHNSILNFNSDSNLENLEKVQAQWLQTKLAWEQAEIYDIGSLNDNFAHNRIDKYPAKYSFLEANLNQETAIDEAFVNNSGSTAKGLPAIEYLVFRFENKDSILYQFTNHASAYQYKNYLTALAKNLISQSEVLQVAIEKERDLFINNTGEGLNTALNDWVNAQISLLEEVISSKINKPLGLNSGGEIDLDKLESPFAKTSLDAIKANLIGLQISMKADTNQVNIYDLLDDIEVNEPILLSTSIEKSFLKNLEKIDAFDQSLFLQLQNDKEKVMDLAISLKELLVLIKVDMVSWLGITVVFNDNDGD